MRAEAKRATIWSGVASVGGMLLAHLPCCGLPAMLGLGGLSFGAGWLESLQPWRPWFIGFALLMAGLTLFTAFRPKQATCGCCTVKIESWKKWSAVILAVIALASAFVQIPAPVSDSHEESHVGHDH